MSGATSTPSERVVYVLGAGFSQPLGLPVISDFLEKAQDQYAAHPENFKEFRLVFEEVIRLSRVRRAYLAPLHNIEEILSLLEMRDLLGGKRRSRRFERFICDVIKYHTPEPTPRGDLNHSNWHNLVFSNPAPLDDFLRFALCLLGLRVVDDRSRIQAPLSASVQVTLRAASAVDYAVVTLNYDRVLEACADHISEVLGHDVGFSTDSKSVEAGGVLLAKLHGDVGTGSIIPPTWSKGSRKDFQPTWKLAYEALAQATQIRVIGYSLAESDTYVRYLLKAAALESGRLKRFDILCKDDGVGTVERRYREFVDLPKMRFRSASTLSLLQAIQRPPVDTSNISRCVLTFGSLEAAHEQIFREEHA